MRRRSNFYGLLMKGVVDPQDGFMDIVENYEETVFTLATAKMVMLEGCKCYKLNQYLWSTVKAYLGEASNETCNAKSSVQILVLTSLLAGYIIWTSYNAFLTSELMVKEKEYPFVDMESLSSTDWKYVRFLKNLQV